MYLSKLNRQWLFLLCIGTASCLTSSVTYNTEFAEVDLNFVSELPPLANNQVPFTSCEQDSDCKVMQTSTASDLTWSCVENLCNPDPILISQTAISKLDFDKLTAGQVSILDTVQIEEIEFDISENTFPFDVSNVEFFWGPTGAASIENSSVRFLGTLGSIPANDSAGGEIDLDETGNNALTDYLKSTDLSVKIFVEAMIDLEPGDIMPTSSTVQTNFILTLRASGELIK